jgi:hypothetical protein
MVIGISEIEGLAEKAYKLYHDFQKLEGDLETLGDFKVSLQIAGRLKALGVAHAENCIPAGD